MRAAGRDIVDRLNQPGPVPVMYSNPIPGVGMGGGLDDVLRARYPDVKISVSGDASKGYTLNRIDVPKSQRNSGIGTQIMQDLVDAVDAQGATLKLSPSGDFGGSVPRLKEFYKRFGFVENKGRNADYAISESMYRTPKPPAAPTLTFEDVERAMNAPENFNISAPVDTSYRMQQQPRGPQDELPIRLDDLTKSTTGEQAGYPADFYSANGPRFYAPGPQFSGDEFGQANKESYRAIMAVRGKPDAEVTIYRAVPNDPNITTINEGDFITLSPTYAKLHGASGYGRSGDEPGKIISQKVKVKDIYFDGNDVNEFGYFPVAPTSGAR
jgi:GNAT superfamily N-acetyltransferase